MNHNRKIDAGTITNTTPPTDQIIVLAFATPRAWALTASFSIARAAAATDIMNQARQENQCQDHDNATPPTNQIIELCILAFAAPRAWALAFSAAFISIARAAAATLRRIITAFHLSRAVSCSAEVESESMPLISEATSSTSRCCGPHRLLKHIQVLEKSVRLLPEKSKLNHLAAGRKNNLERNGPLNP
jgi:hypothetical protein